MARTTAARTAFAAGAVMALAATMSACASPEDDKDPEHRSFALAGDTLTVDSDDSALDIVAVDSNKAGRVEVTRWFKASVVAGKEPKVTWSFEDDRLTLRMKCSGVVADCAARHRIGVPRGVAVRVEDKDGSVRASGFRDALGIRTGDGSVRVSDTSGPVNVRTGDGSVRVTDSSGALKVRTGDGSVRADVSSRRVSTHTGDGSARIELSAVPELVESRSGDGSVTIALPSAKYRVNTETGDGGVDVSVPRDEFSPHVVRARTGDGKVTVRTAN